MARQAHDIGVQKRKKALRLEGGKRERPKSLWRDWCRTKNHPASCSCEYVRASRSSE